MGHSGAISTASELSSSTFCRILDNKLKGGKMKKSPLVQVMVKASIANAFGSGLHATYFSNLFLFVMQTGQPLTLDIFHEWN